MKTKEAVQSSGGDARSPKLIKSDLSSFSEQPQKHEKEAAKDVEEDYFDPWGYDYENSGKDHQYPVSVSSVLRPLHHDPSIFLHNNNAMHLG